MAKLFLVATPIGNLSDITLRALKTLRSCQIIACEDTRLTKKLLNFYEIKNKKLVVHHNFNETKSTKGIISLLEKGFDVALVADAGTPLISDPGYELVKHATSRGIDIEVIPGPSALMVVAQLANFSTTFTFLGFLKPKTIQRQNQLKKLHAGTYIIFISRHKINKTLQDIATTLGQETKVFLARELTKIHQSYYRGTVLEVIEQLGQQTKGEFALALFIPKTKKRSNDSK